MKTIIGRCSLCDGLVMLPTQYMSVVPPIPKCDNCGAMQKLPVIEMVKIEKNLPPLDVSKNELWYKIGREMHDEFFKASVKAEETCKILDQISSTRSKSQHIDQSKIGGLGHVCGMSCNGQDGQFPCDVQERYYENQKVVFSDNE